MNTKPFRCQDKPPRAWHKKRKKMYRVAIVDFRTPIGRETGGHCQCIGEADRWEYPFEVILLRPTGLLDKNGTEIYASKTEGDIVRAGGENGRIGVVLFGEYELLIKWTDKEDPFSLYPYHRQGILEVIGNSLQHPDLLKKE